ncbi:MAG: MTAP family purine nucleoside phosphorylase [Candidatus Thermoplasmatota archaeon]|jgi:5'-methylthioadenosine phosphorylase|nr:MTAP family purine nucleoside phosphorylase [Candidatus Thermoplasmatota archaeon]
MRLGVLAGSVLPLSSPYFGTPVPNEYGTPSSGIWELSGTSGTVLVIARHGSPPTIPPHKVEHLANVRALELSGVDAILSVCSCGALKREVPVPCLAVPDDFVDLFGGKTFIGSEIEHVTPIMDLDLSERLVASCRRAGLDVIEGGTYVQTRGPRLETRAEVRLLSQWGDYVGMNMAPEAVLSMEIGKPYTALLTVDNHAHGVMDGRLDFRDIIESARRSWMDVSRVLLELSEGPAPSMEGEGP